MWIGATSAWTQRSALASPPARSGHALAFDSERGEVVLFGGTKSVTDFNDTWVWRGATSTWIQRSPLSPPSPRSGHALAFDTTHNELVLFGGVANAFALDDTWLHTTLGATCTSSEQCVGANAFCTDNVCCNVAACGTCQTCAGASPGKCTDVQNREDPDTCAGRDGKSCSDVGDCKIALGASASTAADCASGFLADGVCCDSACDGPCQACRIDIKESGERNGQCGNAKSGEDPRSSCPQDPFESCQHDGTCDGHGGCRLYRASASCGPATCLGARASSRLCDGLGTCSATIQGVECGAYACREGTGCNTSCTINTDCGSLHHCESGACVADRGATCDGDTLVGATGERTPCGLYKCAGASCITRCNSNLDCTNGADCSATGACTRFGATAANESDGCALARCSVGSGANSNAIAACVFYLAFRRRLRRSSACVAELVRSLARGAVW